MRTVSVETWQRRRSALLLALSFAGGTAIVQETRADEIDRCLSSHAQSQRLRQGGKLRAAREQLLVCAREICPAMVRSECGPWLTEVDALTPTVVVTARTADGTYVTDVRVTVDGAMLTPRLDGAELALDPGPHGFRYEHAGSAAVEETVVLNEGEKARPLLVTFGESSRMAPAEKANAPSEAPEAARPTPIAAYALGALGIASIASFAGFGAWGLAERSADHCASGCAQAQESSALTKFRIADVSLGAGIVALGVATVLYVTRRSVEPHVVAFDVRPVPGGSMGYVVAPF